MPVCAKKIKHSLKDVQLLAKAKGGKCLSAKYVNNRTPLLWQCAEGHKWKVSLNSIIAGTWCPFCHWKKVGDINRKYTIGDMNAIAKKRGGDCLSKEYINQYTHLLWRCSKGHTWKSIPKIIVNRGSWCPTCRWGNKRKTMK